MRFDLALGFDAIVIARQSGAQLFRKGFIGRDTPITIAQAVALAWRSEINVYCVVSSEIPYGHAAYAS